MGLSSTRPIHPSQGRTGDLQHVRLTSQPLDHGCHITFLHTHVTFHGEARKASHRRPEAFATQSPAQAREEAKSSSLPPSGSNGSCAEGIKVCATPVVGYQSMRDTCGIRTHAGRPHGLSRPTPDPLGPSVLWSGECDGGGPGGGGVAGGAINHNQRTQWISRGETPLAQTRI